MFKRSIEDIFGRANYMFLLGEFYFRLKNLIVEDLPSLKVISNYKIEERGSEKVVN